MHAALRNNLSNIVGHTRHIGRKTVCVATVTELLRECTTTKVEVHEQYLLAGHSNCYGKVGRDEGLTCVRCCREHLDNLRLNAIDIHKAHIGTQDSECLRNTVATILTNNNALAVDATDSCRNISQIRCCYKSLNIATALDGSAERHTEVDNSKGNKEAEQQRSEHNNHCARCNRT